MNFMCNRATKRSWRLNSFEKCKYVCLWRGMWLTILVNWWYSHLLVQFPISAFHRFFYIHLSAQNIRVLPLTCSGSKFYQYDCSHKKIQQFSRACDLRVQQAQNIETVVTIKTTITIIKEQYNKMYSSGCASFSNSFLLLIDSFYWASILFLCYWYFRKSFYRKIWSRVYGNPQIKDQYTALLGIPKASRLDEGVYTCQVSHWHKYFIFGRQ